MQQRLSEEEVLQVIYVTHMGDPMVVMLAKALEQAIEKCDALAERNRVLEERVGELLDAYTTSRNERFAARQAAGVATQSELMAFIKRHVDDGK